MQSGAKNISQGQCREMLKKPTPPGCLCVYPSICRKHPSKQIQQGKIWTCLAKQRSMCWEYNIKRSYSTRPIGKDKIQCFLFVFLHCIFLCYFTLFKPVCPTGWNCQSKLTLYMAQECGWVSTGTQEPDPGQKKHQNQSPNGQQIWVSSRIWRGISKVSYKTGNSF